jgi:hypothetical protein
MLACYLCRTADPQDIGRILENPAVEWSPSLWYAIVYLASQPRRFNLKPEEDK